MRRITFLVALVVLAASSQALANSATDVVDKWLNPGDTGYGGDFTTFPLAGEINLYDIVNQVYVEQGSVWNEYSGTATSTADLVGLEPTQDQIWNLRSGELIAAGGRARYAAAAQELGWYDPSEGAEPTLYKMFDLSDSEPGFHVILNSELTPSMVWSNTGSDASALAFNSLLGASTKSDPFKFGFYSEAPVNDGFFKYSQESRNDQRQDHMLSFLVDKHQTAGSSLTQWTYIFAWEDAPHLGDVDYNDFVVEFVFVTAGEPSNPVPEPGTLTLLSLGALAAMLRKRFVT